MASIGELRMDDTFQAIKRREHVAWKQLFEIYFKKLVLFAEYFLMAGATRDFQFEILSFRAGAQSMFE